MKHYGDICKIHGAVVEPVEVIIGGSPCQDLSVAGKRDGLAGERSGLFMEQIRIIKEMRAQDEKYGAADPRPRYMVWENVPGAFSSNRDEDFRTVLEETARIVDSDTVIPRPPCGWTNSGVIMGDGWSIAWRVHDAQFWGVPQRRRRIALVADFRGYTAPEILFERNRLSRNSEESEKERERTSSVAEECPRGTDTAVVFNGETVTSVQNQTNPHPGDPCHTLGSTGAGRCICVRERCGCDGGGKGVLVQEDKTGTLRSDGYDQFVFSFQGLGQYKQSEVASTIKQRDYKDATDLCVAGFKSKESAKSYSIDYHHEKSPTLSSLSYDKSVVQNDMIRRLTPLEDERLQGFPDNWTNIGFYIKKGKRRKSTDAVRYFAIGNSIAIPFWRWMLSRLIKKCKERTMASLFDGIGGFPLIWNGLGGKTIWASEIEAFPIAVTKYHFGDE